MRKLLSFCGLIFKDRQGGGRLLESTIEMAEASDPKASSNGDQEELKYAGAVEDAVTLMQPSLRFKSLGTVHRGVGRGTKGGGSCVDVGEGV